jgi:predicted SprT family Zn-dependent metalloprotease
VPTPEWASSKAIEILNDFKLKGLIDSSWTFGWNRRKNSRALCSYRKKQISLSIHYVHLSTEEEIMDDILHEISHAIAGFKAGHGILWKSVCRKVGAKPLRCSTEFVEIESKYNGICPVCKTKYSAHRKLKDQNRRLCSKRGCSAKKTKSYIMWTQNY